MRSVLNSAQMKELDRYTIQEMRVPSEVLMERAALAVVDCLEKNRKALGRTLVVCGLGNNAGDGAAIARLLHLKGYRAEIYCPGNPDKFSSDLNRQLAIARNYRVPLVNNPQWSEYTTIVDAVFGVGLNRDVTGEYAALIGKMNQAKAWKVAVDIPSGICADSGEVLGCAFQADETVTFGFLKKGLCLYPGADCAGKVHVSDIGIYEKGIEMPWEYVQAFEEKDLSLLPKRNPAGNKGTFGKVLIVAGSGQIAGAAYLCASACLHSGAGMVKIHTEQKNRQILQTLLPEALLSTYEEGHADFEKLKEDLEWCDVIAAGPGLGQGTTARGHLEFLLENSRKPLVLDADGLNLFAKNPQWKELLPSVCVFTPHLMEMSRLTGRSLDVIRQDLFHEAQEYAGNTKITCVLKDARTVIASPEGRCWLNLSGNEGMATAGSGDVLTGILAAFLTEATDPSLAAALAVYVHGKAGDVACREKGSRWMTAGDIIGGLSQVFEEGEQNGEKI